MSGRRHPYRTCARRCSFLRRSRRQLTDDGSFLRPSQEASASAPGVHTGRLRPPHRPLPRGRAGRGPRAASRGDRAGQHTPVRAVRGAPAARLRRVLPGCRPRLRTGVANYSSGSVYEGELARSCDGRLPGLGRCGLFGLR
jgi:hypothetical protein